MKGKSGPKWLNIFSNPDAEFLVTAEQEGLGFDFILDIEQAMERNGMSRTDLAAALGCSVPNVSKMLSHGQNLTLKSMVRLAKAVGEHVAPIRLACSAPAQPASEACYVVEASVWSPEQHAGRWTVNPPAVLADGGAFEALSKLSSRNDGLDSVVNASRWYVVPDQEPEAAEWASSPYGAH